MSVDLIVEVLTHAPADLNPTERLTLVVIAESCRAGSRMTYYRDGWGAEEVARRVGITPESLTKVFRSLARKGLEVRVPHAVKDGKPVFAFKGKQTTFRLPRFEVQRVDESLAFDQRVDESPGISEGREAKAWTSVRESLDARPGFEAQSLDERPPLLVKELPSRDPSLSSLSREDHSRLATGAVFEREIQASPRSQNEDHSPSRQILAEHDLTGADADEFIAWANRNGVKGDGWYLTVNQRGHMPNQITQFRADLAAGWPNVNQPSPADQRVAEGAALYARYRAREVHQPYLNPAPEDFHRLYDPTKL